ncbi:hypothetical protein TNCV_4951781 [Trichonephila clavipes]|nr:hypothetical protein TNCV_4951781 [Trichonephila clavipes]
MTDLKIVNPGQVTRKTPQLLPLLTTTPHQRENVSTLDRFNVHRSPTWRVCQDYTGWTSLAGPGWTGDAFPQLDRAWNLWLEPAHCPPPSSSFFFLVSWFDEMDNDNFLIGGILFMS